MLFVWIQWYSAYCVVFAMSCHAHLHPPCRPTCLTHVFSMQKHYITERPLHGFTDVLFIRCLIFQK